MDLEIDLDSSLVQQVNQPDKNISFSAYVIILSYTYLHNYFYKYIM